MARTEPARIECSTVSHGKQSSDLRVLRALLASATYVYAADEHTLLCAIRVNVDALRFLSCPGSRGSYSISPFRL